MCPSANEELGTLAENDPLTGYEPNDLHISETTALFIQESSDENRSLNSHDLEFDDYTIGMALSSTAKEKLIVLIKETNNFDEINKFFMNNYWSKIGIFVKLMRRVSMRWEN